MNKFDRKKVEVATRIDVAHDQALTAAVSYYAGQLSEPQKRLLHTAVDALKQLSDDLMEEGE